MKYERQKITVERRAQRGFTLTELMVTVMVLAVLTSAALPAYRSFIVGQRIKTASFDIISSLITARSEAIKRNTNVDIAPNNGSWLNGWTIAVGATPLRQQNALGGGLSVVCYSGAAVAPCTTITYINRGRLPVGSAIPFIQITSSDPSVASGFAVRCISTDLTGRPSSKKASCP